MFILFIVLSLIGIALVVAGIYNIIRTPRPLAYVAVPRRHHRGGAAGLILLTTTVF